MWNRSFSKATFLFFFLENQERQKLVPKRHLMCPFRAWFEYANQVHQQFLLFFSILVLAVFLLIIPDQNWKKRSHHTHDLFCLFWINLSFLSSNDFCRLIGFRQAAMLLHLCRNCISSSILFGVGFPIFRRILSVYYVLVLLPF